MISDRNRIYDGWWSLQGGVDAGRAPDTIDPVQAVSAINMTFRGGSASTRPGFRKITEEFPAYRVGTSALSDQTWCFNSQYQEDPVHNTHIYLPGEYCDFDVFLLPDNNPAITQLINGNEEYVYRHGIFQCATAYSPHHGEDCIMAMIGGRLFKIIPDVATAKVHEVVPDGDQADPNFHNFRNNKSSPIAYMCQADKWLIAQDGESRPILYDNVKARRSIITTDPDATEVPVGTIMTYGMGRLIVVVNKRDIAFGDLYGSHDLPDPADSLILFTERNFLSEGFDAAVPFTQGTVTGLIFFPQLDTSTGNGQLMAFAERGATSFFLSLPREQWKTSQFQILSLLTTGLRGHRSIAVVNEDLWFRSDDGIRSYRQARSENTGWPHLPLSTNVRQYTENDSDWLLRYGSAIYFDNRVIFTVSPMWNHGRPIHWGMLAVDFDILSSFGAPATARPAWEGQWTASSFVFPIQLLTGTFKGVTRAFMFAIDNNGHNQLFELSRSDYDDWGGQRIEWEMVSRALDFQKLSQESTPFTENELYGADLWLREIVE